MVSLLFIAGAGNGAAEIAIAFDAGEIWLGNPVTITCISNQTAGMWAVVEEPIKANLFNTQPLDTLTSSISYRPPVEGNYSIRCTDGVESSRGRSLLVSDLKSVVLKSTSSVFSDEDISIELKLSKTPAKGAVSEGVDFSLFLDGRQLALEPPFFFQDRWTIRTQDNDLSAGERELILEAAFENKKITVPLNVSIRPAIEFSFSMPNTDLVAGQKKSIAVTGLYKGVSFTEEIPMRLLLDGSPVEFDKTEGGIDFYAPEKQAGEYGLALEADFNGMTLKKTAEIVYVVSVKGELSSAPEPVSGSLDFSADGFRKSIQVVSGRYENTLPIGVYDMAVRINPVTATFSGIEIDSSQKNLLRFGLFPETGIEGMKIATGFAIEISQPFLTGTIEASYDASKVGDESSLKVLTCRNWNLDAKVCSSGWESTAAEIDTIANKVKIPVKHLSAYVVGEKKRLNIEVKFDKERYYFNDLMKVTGIIRSGGDFIGDVNIDMSLLNSTTAIKANEQGVFSETVPVPKQDGLTSLFFRAYKSSYEPGNTTVQVSIERKREMAIVLPLQAEMLAGKTGSFEASVINTGQTELNNVRFSISGLGPEKLDYTPESWDLQLPGEERKVKIAVFGIEKGKSTITLPVKVESDEVTKDDMLVILVKEGKEEAAQPPAEAQGDMLTGLFAGLVPAVQPNLTDSLLAGGIIVLLILIARRRRKPQPFSQPLLGLSQYPAQGTGMMQPMVRMRTRRRRTRKAARR